jgi:hypothetical protein
LTDFTDDTQVSRFHDEAVRAAQALAVATRDLERLRGLRDETNAELRQRRESTVEDYYATFDPRRNCPLPQCPFRPENRTDGMADPEREARIAELEAILARHNGAITEVNEQLPSLRQQHSEAESRYVQERRRREGNIAGTLRDIGRWQLIAEEVRDYEAARRNRENQQNRVDRLERNIRESRERQEVAREAQAARHRRLSQYFDWTLKRLLMPEAQASKRTSKRKKGERGRPLGGKTAKRDRKLYLDWKAAHRSTGISKAEFLRERGLLETDLSAIERGRKQRQPKEAGN